MILSRIAINSMKVALTLLLLSTATALRAPLSARPTRRAVLGSAMTTAVALPAVAELSQRDLTTIEEIAARANAEAEADRAEAETDASGHVIQDAGVTVSFVALLGMLASQANEWMRFNCGPLSDDCDVSKVEFPEGWDKVPSRSRPGKFSFMHLASGNVYDAVPHWAWAAELGETSNFGKEEIFAAPFFQRGAIPTRADTRTSAPEEEEVDEEEEDLIAKIEEALAGLSLPGPLGKKTPAAMEAEDEA